MVVNKHYWYVYSILYCIKPHILATWCSVISMSLCSLLPPSDRCYIDLKALSSLFTDACHHQCWNPLHSEKSNDSNTDEFTSPLTVPALQTQPRTVGGLDRTWCRMVPAMKTLKRKLPLPLVTTHCVLDMVKWLKWWSMRLWVLMPGNTYTVQIDLD